MPQFIWTMYLQLKTTGRQLSQHYYEKRHQDQENIHGERNPSEARVGSVPAGAKPGINTVIPEQWRNQVSKTTSKILKTASSNKGSHITAQSMRTPSKPLSTLYKEDTTWASTSDKQFGKYKCRIWRSPLNPQRTKINQTMSLICSCSNGRIYLFQSCVGNKVTK